MIIPFKGQVKWVPVKLYVSEADIKQKRRKKYRDKYYRIGQEMRRKGKK